jgi:hypothetical protein
MSLNAQNIKTGPDALCTAENMAGSAKHENGTRRPRYRQKLVPSCKTWKRNMSPSGPSNISLGAQNMKMGPDALGTAENMSGSAKYENGTGRPRYRRKWVRTRKTWKRYMTPSVPRERTSGAQNMKTTPGTLISAGNESGNAKLANLAHREWDILSRCR